MRRNLIIAALFVAIITASVLVTRSRDHEPVRAEKTGLQTRTLRAGEIDVEINPRRLNDQGAVFAITLDTHAAELSMDLSLATLDVDGTAWAFAAWEGDGPSGHHREGELRFEAGGKALGTVRLVLSGFSEAVDATWELGN